MSAESLQPEATVPSLGFLLSVALPAILLVCMRIINTVQSDYQDFVSLGPGGTPSTPTGYLRIKFLSLFALRDPYSPAPVPFEYNHQRGNITSTLPARHGPRPIVRGIAPHRQTNQRASVATFAKLRSQINELALGNPEFLIQKTSCLEKHGPGLFAKKAKAMTRHCSGEVCHAHPSDGSLHLTLHPADAAVVMKAGWGERHPLGGGGWLQRFVPDGFIMVYAPRDDAEIEVVMDIIKASVWWIGGIDINVPGDTPEDHFEYTAGPNCMVSSI
jgi:hypothetical protein